LRQRRRSSSGIGAAIATNVCVSNGSRSAVMAAIAWQFETAFEDPAIVALPLAIGVVGIPISIGVAILRHRLLDTAPINSQSTPYTNDRRMMSSMLAVEPPLAAREWVAWAGGLTVFAGIACIPLALLAFPDGTLLSRRWRLAVASNVAAAVVLAFTAALSSPLLGRSDGPEALAHRGVPPWKAHLVALLSAAKLTPSKPPG
jgi:hypothetical protein